MTRLSLLSRVAQIIGSLLFLIVCSSNSPDEAQESDLLLNTILAVNRLGAFNGMGPDRAPQRPSENPPFVTITSLSSSQFQDAIHDTTDVDWYRFTKDSSFIYIGVGGVGSSFSCCPSMATVHEVSVADVNDSALWTASADGAFPCTAAHFCRDSYRSPSYLSNAILSVSNLTNSVSYLLRIQDAGRGGAPCRYAITR
ncbi:MAG: hypothetical protein K1X75_18100 [Leptospirales bacterium]|nr:hypothetical protein [Leptospirales bacterium]